MAEVAIKLYNLPSVEQNIADLKSKGIEIKRPMASEKSIVVKWVKKEFGSIWANECDVAFSNHPVSCFIALKDDRILGFCCYDVSAKNFYGPIGVSEGFRAHGIGTALTLVVFHAMAGEGYAYAIVPTDSVDYYVKHMDGVIIDRSAAIFKGMLKENKAKK